MLLLSALVFCVGTLLFPVEGRHRTVNNLQHPLIEWIKDAHPLDDTNASLLPLKTKNAATILRGEDVINEKDTVLLYFSAHWCGPCRMFTPVLKTWYDNLPKNHNVKIIFVSHDESSEEAEQYFEQSHGDWLLLDMDERGEEFGKETISSKYDVRGFPSLVLVKNTKGAPDSGIELRGQIENLVRHEEWGVPQSWIERASLDIEKKVVEVLDVPEDNEHPFMRGCRATLQNPNHDTLPLLEKTSSGEIVKSSQKLTTDDVVLLYFSASWCPPCKKFTQSLRQWHNGLTAQAKQRVKLIFVSSDKQKDQAYNYFRGHHGDWLMLEFGSFRGEQLKGVMAGAYGVRGIPSLKLLTQEEKTPAVSAFDMRSEIMMLVGKRTDIPEKWIMATQANNPLEKSMHPLTFSCLLSKDDETAETLPLVEKQGNSIVKSAQTLGPNDMVLLYFSASWCPPCRQFTNALKEWHDQLEIDEKAKIKLIFVSLDRTKEAGEAYFRDHHGDWLMVEQGERGSAIKDALAQGYSVQGIPDLKLLRLAKSAPPARLDMRQEIFQNANSSKIPQKWVNAVTIPQTHASPVKKAAAPKKVVAKFPGQLIPGDRVTVSGIISKPELNKQGGSLHSIFSDGNPPRATVNFRNPKLGSASLKRACLTLAGISCSSDGEKGEVLHSVDNTKNEYVVKMQDAVKTLPLDSIEFGSGTRVVLRDLAENAELNGKTGVIEGCDESENEYNVLCFDKTVRKIGRKNVYI